MKKKIILFDFDGVIADSFEMAFEVNQIIDRSIVTKNDLRRLFDGNIYDQVKLANKKESEKIHKEFFKMYIPRMKEVQVVSGMKEVITELAKTYTLLIISSTITSPISGFLEDHKIRHHFTEIVSGESFDTNKVERMKKVFEKYQSGPEDCVFITDTLGDMREATNVGVSSIGVTWGFQEEENLLRGNPFHIADSPGELLLVVTKYFKQAHG